MRLPVAARRGAGSGAGGELPLWPPLLAVRGPGGASGAHAHHAMHVVVCTRGTLRWRAGGAGTWAAAPGVITGPDVVHELDATGAEVLLVFVDPESEVGTALHALVGDGVRALAAREVAAIAAIDPAQDPMAIMAEGGTVWTTRVVEALGGPSLPVRTVHPAVRRLLRRLREAPADADTSLEALARSVRLSPGRLMHAFTASVGVPLRPYLAWLKLQRAAAAISRGERLSEAAHAAGFADAGHMTRSFRRMLGTPPSALRPGAGAGTGTG